MNDFIKPFLTASLAALSLSFSGCAEAQSTDINSADTKQIEQVQSSSAANWDIQVNGSHIKFMATQEGKPFSGAFSEFSGTIKFDPEIPETGHVKITIPLKAVDAGSNDRNSTLPSKVWFSAKKFPEATFTSENISKQGDGFLAKGELMLKGVSVPLDLPFTLKIDGNQAVMTGAVDMDRTLWGVGAAPWDTDEWVSRTVSLDIQVTATREN